VLSKTIVEYLLLNLCGPVLITLSFALFFDIRQHHDKVNAFLLHHPPKVLSRPVERPLRRNEELVVLASRRINIVCIDV
jgi:hypothetical protein